MENQKYTTPVFLLNDELAGMTTLLFLEKNRGKSVIEGITIHNLETKSTHTNPQVLDNTTEGTRMSLGITLHEGFQFSLSQTGGEPTVVPTIPFPEQRNELNNPAVGAPGHNREGVSKIIDISVFREKSEQERKIAEHEKACKYTNEMLSELHQLITTSLSN